jgi:hypothetical protein
MYYLVYLSAAAPHFEEKDLKDILIKSRENNQKLGITGILLFHEGNFIQVLEGERKDIELVYKKINNDLRHKSIIKILEEPIEQRNFPQWSMGYKTLSTDEVRTLTGYDSLSKTEFLQNFTHEQNRDRKIVTLLRSFVKDNM